MNRVTLYTFFALAVLSFLLPGRLAAQDITNFTQFYFNPSLLNSSYTGIDGQPALYISYKKQWAGFDGSPAIANVNIQTALPSQLGLGLNLNNSRSGQLNISSAHFSGAYGLPLGKDQFLRFGLSAGVSSTTVDINALTFGTPNDPILAELVKTNMQLIGNFGVSFHAKDFHAGISLPTIFTPTYWNRDAFTISKVDPFGTVIIHASNRFYLEKGKNVFEPYVVYRLNSSLPGQFEVAGVFHIQSIVYVGADYKQDFGISALAGFKINKLTALGYSYTIQASGNNQVGRPSHEIQFGLLLGKRQKEVQAYSFVDTDKARRKTPQEVAAEKKKAAAELAKKQQEEKAKQAALKAEEDKKAAAALAERKRLAAQKAHTDSLALTAEHHAQEQAQLDRIAQHADNPMEEHNETGHPNAERHEFVKQGGHHEELELGHYVIAGVFRLRSNAKRYSDDLLKLGFKDTEFGFLTQHNVWYVHIAQEEDIEGARKARDEFRKLRIHRDAWLLTVEK